MLEVLAKLQTDAELVTSGDAPFRLRLPQGEQDVLGPLLTQRLEAARDDMQARWGVSSPDGVLVEVFDKHADFSVRTVGFEGLGALGACFGRVMTLLSPLCELRGNFQWAQTAVHEYAHVVTLTLSHQRIPRWLTEGLSVQEEKKANPAWARPLERDVLDARANGQLPPVERLDESFRDGETIMLGYYQGSLLAEVIERDFGFAALHDLVAAFADGLDTPAAIRRVLKVEPADVDRRLLDYVDHVVGARAVIRPHRNEHGEALARQRAQAGDVEAWLDVAQACLDLQRRADADAALDHYLKARGETPAALEVLARRDLLDGHAQSARDRLQRWAKDGQPNADGLRQLAELQLTAGDKEQGLATLEQARALFPGDVGPGSAVARLIGLRREANDEEGVAALLETVAAHDSTALEPRLVLARRALKAGHSDEALRWFGEAAEIDPYRPDVRLEYADALVAAGHAEAAHEQWQLILGLRDGQMPEDLAAQTPLAEFQQKAREKLH
jgi:tetratricopeptide (TPR) repeat protein